MSTLVIASWIVFRCVNHQLSCHEPSGHGTVHGVVYRNKLKYTGNTLQSNISQGSTINTFSVCSLHIVSGGWKCSAQGRCRASRNVWRKCRKHAQGHCSVCVSWLDLQLASCKCCVRKCVICYKNVFSWMLISCKWCRQLRQITG
jgi:hypothetical protein